MRLALPTARPATLPPNECFWAVLQGRSARGLRGERRRRALLYELEPELPLPVEEVHAVFVDNTDGTVTACACRRNMLQTLWEHADVVVPEEIPQWTACNAPSESFNLSFGSMASPRSRLLSRRRTLALLGVCAALGLVLTAGFLRRASAAEQKTLEAISAIETAHALVLPVGGPNTQPASIRLAATLRAAQFAAGAAVLESSPSASGVLHEILRFWPDDSRLQRLAIGKHDIRIDLGMPLDQDPSGFIGQVETLDGWSLAAPIIRRDQESLTLSLSLRRTAENSG